MKKPLTLRRHLEAAIPHLKSDPDKLRAWIDEGAVACKQGASLSFEWRYNLNLLFIDFVGSPDQIVVPLLSWIESHQYDLFADPEKRLRALTFESEVIDHEKIDIQFKLPLSERVIVTQTASGWSCHHVDEPPLPEIEGVRPWQVFLKGELIGESDTLNL